MLHNMIGTKKDFWGTCAIGPYWILHTGHLQTCWWYLDLASHSPKTLVSFSCFRNCLGQVRSSISSQVTRDMRFWGRPMSPRWGAGGHARVADRVGARSATFCENRVFYRVFIIFLRPLGEGAETNPLPLLHSSRYLETVVLESLLIKFLPGKAS